MLSDVAAKSVRIVIHAGTHKTGTTSIQKVLNQNREAFRSEGLFYPDESPHLGGSPKAHHLFARGVTGADPLELAQARRFVSQTMTDARPGDTILISSESIYRHVFGDHHWRALPNAEYWDSRIAYLSKLDQILGNSSKQIVLFLRRPDKFAESAYKEWVLKSRPDKSFHEWIESSGPLLDYSGQVRAFSSIFADVQIFQYEAARQQGLLPSFFQFLNVTPPRKGARARRSPDSRIILWVIRSQLGTLTQRQSFARSEVARQLFEDHGTTSLWASRGERDAFLERYDGPYGAGFFDLTRTESIYPAFLSRELVSRIDHAFKSWLSQDSPLVGP